MCRLWGPGPLLQGLAGVSLVGPPTHKIGVPLGETGGRLLGAGRLCLVVRLVGVCDSDVPAPLIRRLPMVVREYVLTHSSLALGREATAEAHKAAEGEKVALPPVVVEPLPAIEGPTADLAGAADGLRDGHFASGGWSRRGGLRWSLGCPCPPSGRVPSVAGNPGVPPGG